MKLKKFNSNHDKRGRFAKKPGAASPVAAPVAPQKTTLDLVDPARIEVSNRINPLESMAIASQMERAIKTFAGMFKPNADAQAFKPMELRIVHSAEEAFMGRVQLVSQPDEDLIVPGILTMNAARVENESPGEVRAVMYHELGHVIDRWMARKHTSLGHASSKEIESADDPESVPAWGVMNAISESPTGKAYADLYEGIYNQILDRPNKPKGEPDQISVWQVNQRRVNRRTRDVALEQDVMARLSTITCASECFARAVCQYIATKSGDKDALKWCTRSTIGSKDWAAYYEVWDRKEDKVTILPSLFHWPEEEFKPIMAELDKLFASRGVLA